VAEANLTAQEAATRQADLDLKFTELVAPISGRIGDRRVSIGNLVTGGTAGNTTLLATIVSVDPIRFEFTMDEASYLRYVNAVSGGQSKSVDRDMKLPAQLKLIDENDFVHEGRIDFVDNAIDRSSGTIRGRAEFSNPDGKLTPGMFGRIRISTSPPAEALLVPDKAIGTEQVRKFVYAVGSNNVATPKYVTLGPVVDGLRVIKAGLSADDSVMSGPAPKSRLSRHRPKPKPPGTRRFGPTEQRTARCAFRTSSSTARFSRPSSRLFSSSSARFRSAACRLRNILRSRLR
jgi:RND family efflux transporter MFP subunit